MPGQENSSSFDSQNPQTTEHKSNRSPGGVVVDRVLSLFGWKRRPSTTSMSTGTSIPMKEIKKTTLKIDMYQRFVFTLSVWPKDIDFLSLILLALKSH